MEENKENLQIQRNIGKRLEAKIRRDWIHIPIGIYIAIILLFFLTLLMQFNPELRHKIWNIIAPLLSFSDRLLEYKNLLSERMKDFCELFATFSTILAAAVILFYSIMDSRKEGIPHRMIMSFAFGSKTIPTLYMLVMFMVPASYLFYTIHWYCLLFLFICFVFILQIIGIYVILRVASFQYGVKVICKLEFVQCQFLINENVDIYNKKAYIMPYITRSMEIVMGSNELSADKMYLIERLLRVPYCTMKKWTSNPEVCKESLICNKAQQVYQYYYYNLLGAYEQMDENNSFEINVFFEKLYEFIDEFSKKLCKDEAFLVVLFAIINACSSSRIENSSNFIKHIFKNCVPEDRINQVITIYILSQEFIYRTETTEIDNMVDVLSLKDWEFDVNDKDICRKMWDIWSSVTSLSESTGYTYLLEALDTLEGKAYLSMPVSFYTTAKNQQVEGLDANENKNCSTEK